jgi:predicted permease
LTQYVPEFLINAFDSAGKCQGPVAMVLAGFVIGGYNFRELISNKKVYIASLLRLIVIPAVILLMLKGIGTSKEVMTLALIAFGTPLGLNTIVYPAAYGGETKTGASMTMISHTLSVITIPLMYLLFIVWL